MLRPIIFLLVLAALALVARWIFVTIRAYRSGALTARTAPGAIRTSGKDSGWHVEEKSDGSEAVVVTVLHPSQGTRRRWRIEQPETPEGKLHLLRARADAQALLGELNVDR